MPTNEKTTNITCQVHSGSVDVTRSEDFVARITAVIPTPNADIRKTVQYDIHHDFHSVGQAIAIL